MHVIAPLKGKVALVQKPSVWEEEIQDKKSLWTKIPLVQEIPGISNALGQEIPRDKKSPGTRNPPGQEILRDKKSPGTSNPPGQAIPWDIK